MPVFWPLAFAPVLLLLLRGARRPWLRLVAVLLLIVAACGPRLPLGRRDCHLAIVADRSASIGGRVEVPRDIPSGWSSVSLVEFGRDASVALPPTTPPIAAWPQARVDGSATDVEAALRLASTLSPADRELGVVLMTDGRETRGDVRRAIAGLRARGGVLFTLPVPSAIHDVRIAELAAPSEVAEGAPVPVRVEVRATTEQVVRVTLSAEGKVLAERDGVGVTPDREARVQFTLPPLQGPVLPLEARVVPATPDAIPENDVAWAVVRRTGKPKVLLVAEPGRRLEQVLEKSGAFDLRVSGAFEGAEMYDAIVLDDRPADGLPDLRPYLRDARGGLVAVGGPRSFGPGGYAGTPLEEVLPVWCLPKEAFSLVVALDSSGSMGEGTLGATKYETALLSLQAVKQLLRSGDRVELVRFAGENSSEGFVSASRFPDVLAGARGRSPSGPTAMVPALQRCVADLEKETSPRRHLLVISDGELAPEEAGPAAFASLSQKLTAMGAGRTVVVTGEHPSEAEMRALGGRYLRIDQLEMLPAALHGDLVEARRLVEDNPEAPSSSKSPPLPLDLREFPAMGRDRVTPKDEATSDYRFSDGTPLFASWPVGTGAAVAIPTTLESPWGDGWSSRPDALVFWTTAIRSVLRPPGEAGVTWGVEGDRLVVRCPGPFRRLRARVTPCDGEARDLDLVASGAGRYTVALPDLPPGMASLSIAGAEGPVASGAVAIPPGREWREVGADRATLEEWARLGGGRVLDGGLPGPPRGTMGAPWAIGPWIAALAIALLFLDALRRTSSSPRNSIQVWRGTSE